VYTLDSPGYKKKYCCAQHKTEICVHIYLSVLPHVNCRRFIQKAHTLQNVEMITGIELEETLATIWKQNLKLKEHLEFNLPKLINKRD